MKAKYKHYGTDCIIYNQVICDDNIVATVETVSSCWGTKTTEKNIIICDNEQKAINLYNTFCNKLQHNKYDCEYRD